MRLPRGLYWRIAIGFVFFLAAMLVVQAILFTWVVSRSGQTIPGQSPTGFAQTVALDVTAALERDRQLDLDRYVHDQFAKVTHPFFILLASGRIIDHGASPIPEPLMRLARARLRRAERFERFDAERQEREGGLRFMRPAPITVDGEVIGVVVVPARAPFGFLLGRFAPTLGLVAGGVLVVGTALWLIGSKQKKSWA